MSIQDMLLDAQTMMIPADESLALIDAITVWQGVNKIKPEAMQNPPRAERLATLEASLRRNLSRPAPDEASDEDESDDEETW